MSATPSTEVEIENFYADEDLSLDITRAKFESLCRDDFKKIKPVIEVCLEDARVKKSEIDRIIMVGGSARIPAV